MNGPTRERGGASRPQGEAPSPSVDLLAAQVRAGITTGLTSAKARTPALAALDALVARVTEAERERDELADSCARVTRAFEKEAARAADARNALERALRMPGCNQLECTRTDHLGGAVREVLARLDGSSGK